MTLGEFFTGLGYFTGLFVLVLAARQKRLLTDGMFRIAVIALVAGGLGAKLTEYLFEGWPFKLQPLSIFNPENGGKSLLGGLLFGWIAAEIAKRQMGIKRSVGDLFALALPAGEAVGRIGCYYNGCCYGTVTSGSFAVYQHGAWRYPSQLLSAVTAAAIVVVLLMARKHLHREGDLFKLYLLLFGITRFGLEFIRERPLIVWNLSAMQLFCFDLMLFGAIGLWVSMRKQVRPAEAVSG